MEWYATGKDKFQHEIHRKLCVLSLLIQAEVVHQFHHRHASLQECISINLLDVASFVLARKEPLGSLTLFDGRARPRTFSRQRMQHSSQFINIDPF